MSRSYKKAYSYIVCCNSLKRWRSSYNRRFRHIENSRVNNDMDYMCWKTPYKFGYADRWAGPSDGGAFYCIASDYPDSLVKRKFMPFKRHGHFLFRK